VTRSVIFDCDGVLVDTERISNTVLAGLLTDAGLPTTFEQCMDIYRGRSLASVMELAVERHGGPLPDDIPARYYAAVEAIFARELEAVPGVVAALDKIALPSCVASSGPHHKMAVTLRTTGLWERFEGRIFSATEVPRGKPAPDLFLHAARQMGFDPAATAVVEDSVPGVEAARAAGMRALAFARNDDAEAALLAAAGGETFHDMAELPDLLAA
ncbi:MAG TPA: HAD family hydrolase, partial [Solirubrobacteraceae bacterium]|jgi:HAD superfamily hydrolase (TIGR01509 family)|nr:HAD family hydrolase [Solirubrobacteraceae bacterium]